MSNNCNITDLCSMLIKLTDKCLVQKHFFIINFSAIMLKTNVQNGIISTICSCVFLVRLILIGLPKKLGI